MTPSTRARMERAIVAEVEVLDIETLVGILQNVREDEFKQMSDEDIEEWFHQTRGE